MAGMGYRPQNKAYAIVGSSALEYQAAPAYQEEWARAAPQQTRGRPYKPPARRQSPQGVQVRTLTMLVALGLMAAVLCGISINKRADVTKIQRQMAQVQQQIKATQEANLQMERQLTLNTDGEHIRNYAVNTLQMEHVQAAQVRTVRMPDTRPLGAKTTADVQEIQTQEGGMMAILAGLLRWIRL